MHLTPEDIEKVRTKHIANLIRRAQEGKPLTKGQQAELEAFAAGGALQGESSSGYVKTQEELAEALDVSRRTISSALQRFKDADPPPPKTRADGRYEVAAWAAFFRAHNIADAADNEAAEAGPGQEAWTQNDWKRQELRLKCAKLETELELAQGKLLEVAELERELGTTLSAFRTALNNLPGRASDKLIGLDDYHEIKEILEGEITVVLRTLHGCAWLRGSAPSVAEQSEGLVNPSKVFHVEHSEEKTEELPRKSARPGAPRKAPKGKIRSAKAPSEATEKRSPLPRKPGPEKKTPAQKGAKRKAAKGGRGR